MSLYQQGTQKIEIIVRKDISGSDNGAKEVGAENVTASNAETSTAATSGKSGGTLSYRQARMLRVSTLHSWGVMKQVGETAINYYVSGLGDMYGDEALQARAERVVESVTDVGGFASSVGMGAASMSWAGPVGMIIGGSLGAISSGASIGSKYASRRREFNYKVFKENNAIEYQRARASINYTTGRLR